MGDNGEKAVSHIQFFYKEPALAKFHDKIDDCRKQQDVEQQERPAQPYRHGNADSTGGASASVPSAEDIGLLFLQFITSGTDLFREPGILPVYPFSSIQPVSVFHQGSQGQAAVGIYGQQAVGVEGHCAQGPAEGKKAIPKLAGNVFSVDIGGKSQLLGNVADAAVRVNEIQSVLCSRP